MSNQPTVQEILADNIKLLQFYTRREARPGLWILSFDGALMPDGYECEIQIKGDLNHAALMGACEEVRRTYNERIGRIEAEESVGDTPRKSGNTGADRPTPEPRGASVPEEATIPDVEVPLETIIESKVVRLRVTIADLESRIRECSERRLELLEHLTRAEAAWEIYNNGQITESEPTSDTGPGSTEEAADPEGPATDGHEGED